MEAWEESVGSGRGRLSLTRAGRAGVQTSLGKERGLQMAERGPRGHPAWVFAVTEGLGGRVQGPGPGTCNKQAGAWGTESGAGGATRQGAAWGRWVQGAQGRWEQHLQVGVWKAIDRPRVN